MVVMNTRRQLSRQQQLGLRLAGVACLAATGAIHLDLYLTGYNSLHVIGPLFLLQVIAAFALALAVLLLGSRPVGRLAAAAGPASPSLPWPATCCPSGSACSASVKSAPPRGSSPG